jgi:hypothetical protein
MTDPSEQPEAERAAEAEVEAALRSLPMRPAPRGLVQATLARVRSSARPPFRLSWIDLALGTFGTLMAALALLAWGTLRQAAGADLRRMALVTDQAPEVLVLGVILGAGLVLMALGAFVGLVLLVQRRRPR